MSAAERPTSYRELAGVIEGLPMLIREARRANGLSIRSAAVQIGASFSTVTRIEHGEGYNIDALVSVLRWLDKTPPIGDDAA